MDYFFDQMSDIKLADGMEESPILKERFSIEIKHQGRTYSLFCVYVRQLSFKKKFLTFFECLAKAVLSLGTLLFDKDFRDKWQSVFTDKHIRAVYLPFKPNDQTFEAKRETLESKIQIPNGRTDQNRNLSLALIVFVKQKINLNNFFARTSMDEGFNPLLLKPEESDLMNILAQRWFERVDSNKSSWTIKELATLLKINKIELEELCHRLQLFTGPSLPLNSLVVDWLFNSVKKTLENKPRATMHWGVKMIWNPRMEVPGKENRFPNGVDKTDWKFEELSMFLAVKKEALAQFFIAQKVLLNKEGNYSSQDISHALTTATNGEINVMLEKNRTQTQSLRFYT
jgi:hypothetical protein